MPYDSGERGILEAAGFGSVAVERLDGPIWLGASPQAAAERAVRFGPASRFVREMGGEHLPTIQRAIESSLAALAATDGSVSLPGSTWVVTASSQA